MGNGNQPLAKQAINKVEYIKPYQWKPGQSGNPNGRPKVKLVSEYVREKLADINPLTNKTVAEEIAEKVINQAIEGIHEARNTLLDRTEGKVIQTYSIDKQEVKITGSLDDLIKLRELALSQQNVTDDTQHEVIDVTTGNDSD